MDREAEDEDEEATLSQCVFFNRWAPVIQACSTKDELELVTDRWASD